MVGPELLLVLAFWITKVITQYRLEKPYADRGEVPPRIQAKIAKYEAGAASRPPARPGARGYLRELWHDAWDDATERRQDHRAKRKADKQTATVGSTSTGSGRGTWRRFKDRVKGWAVWAITPLGEYQHSEPEQRDAQADNAEHADATDDPQESESESTNDPAATDSSDSQPAAPVDVPVDATAKVADPGEQYKPRHHGEASNDQPTTPPAPAASPTATPSDRPFPWHCSRCLSEGVEPSEELAEAAMQAHNCHPALHGPTPPLSDRIPQDDLDRWRNEMLGKCAYHQVRPGFDDEFCENPYSQGSRFCWEHRADKAQPTETSTNQEGGAMPQEITGNEALRSNLKEMQAGAKELADAMALAEAARAKILAASAASSDGVNGNVKFDASAVAAVNDINDNISPTTLSDWAQMADNVDASASAGLTALEKYVDSEALVAETGVSGKTLENAAA
jgi:hypothetical protein